MTEIAHICIVSEQLLANLIPALMLKPERVFLAASVDMEGRGFSRRLTALLERQGFLVEIKRALPSGGLSSISDFARQWLEEIRKAYPGTRLVMNLTGGNKLMTIAFLQAMRAQTDGMIYTDTANGVLEYLAPADEPRTVPLSGVLNVPLYLAAQGMAHGGAISDSPAWRDRAVRRRPLTRYLGREARALGSFLGAVNRLANAALDDRGETLLAPRQSFDRPPWGSWRVALDAVTRTGVARFDGGMSLIFPDAESARYLSGGWLEEYAWHAARALTPDDVGMGVTGHWEDTQRGGNELDLVVVHLNRLLLIECKTLRLGRPGAEESDSALIYKLDSIGDDLKGLFGEVVLLSAREPSPQVVDRAGHHRIRVVGPDRLERLAGDIALWMRSGQFP